MSSPGGGCREPALGAALEPQAFTALLFGPSVLLGAVLQQEPRAAPGTGSTAAADLCCALLSDEPLGTMWQGSHFPKHVLGWSGICST